MVLQFDTEEVEVKKASEAQRAYLLARNIKPLASSRCAFLLISYIKHGNGAKGQGKTESERIAQILFLRQKYQGKRIIVNDQQAVVRDVLPRSPREMIERAEGKAAAWDLKEVGPFRIHYEIVQAGRRIVTSASLSRVQLVEEEQPPTETA